MSDMSSVVRSKADAGYFEPVAWSGCANLLGALESLQRASVPLRTSGSVRRGNRVHFHRNSDVRIAVANGGKPDTLRTAQFGRQ